jgi:hypothetical protein
MNGGTPPVVAMESETAIPYEVAGREVVVMAGGVFPLTNIVNALVLLCPTASCTCTVNVAGEAADVGVPEITPVDELSESPFGKAPLVTLHENGVAGKLALAESEVEIGVPTIPGGKSGLVLMEGMPARVNPGKCGSRSR